MTGIGIEDEHVEFKKSLAERDRAYKALVAMLNKHCEGTVYFGVSDDGTVIGTDVGKDTLRTISQEIADKIEPTVIPIIDVLTSDDSLTYIRVKVQGTARPYNKEGFYYIRSGEENRAIPSFELRKMFQSYSDQLKLSESFNQGLSFSELVDLMKSNGLHVKDDEKLCSHYQLMMPNGKYNIVAELVSDQNPIPLTVVIFSGTDKRNIAFRSDFSGHSLIKEVLEVSNYVLSLNETSVDMSGPVRRDVKLFDAEAFREAWFNAAVHNTWIPEIPPTIHIFDDRMEIVSIGSTPYGQSEEDFFSGVSTPVNESLMRLFIATGICEHTGHGVPVITRAYGREAFKISGGYVMVTIPFSKNRSAALLRRGSDDGLTDNERTIIGIMEMDPKITIREITVLTGINESTIKAAVSEMKKSGLVEREGSRKKGTWIVKSKSSDRSSLSNR